MMILSMISPFVFDEFSLAFVKHLDEKHVTWARFGEKLDKNTTLQACNDVEFLIKSVNSQCVKTASEITPDAARIEERWRQPDGVTIADKEKPIEDSMG
ncbi:hypothetical protein Tco_0940755 [Tanacetum coccineum]|uniref:Uncharacterized protein n=1 Tax=Tanacetum coccineum TaxID=301880 RepID=A0ABQ5DNW1_9ASTR